MLTLSPSIGMPKERFLTRFQRDQVDRAFWNELKSLSSSPQKVAGQEFQAYRTRVEELKQNSKLKDEFLNLGAEMKAMVGVRPNPKVANHARYHERWEQLCERVTEKSEDAEPAESIGKKAKTQLNRFRDEDTDWFVRNSADLANGLGTFSTIAGTVALVTGSAALAISLTGVGAIAGAPLGLATGVIGGASIAAKILQGAVVWLDPKTAEGSSRVYFVDAAKDVAFLAAGGGAGKVLAGAKNLAAVERLQGLAFLKDWRGMTLQVLKKMDSMVKFINAKFDRPRLQRIFGPSGLLMGPAELKAKALKQIDRIEMVHKVLEWVKDAFDYGGNLVKAFLGVVSGIKDGIVEGAEDLGEFIEGTGIRLTDAIREAAEQLIALGHVGPELLARWGIAQGRRIVSAGQRAARGIRSGVWTGARRGVAAGRKFVVWFAAGVDRAVIQILLRANLLSRRVLATGEEIFECVSEQVYRAVQRILNFLQPGAEFTLSQMTQIVSLIGTTFSRAAHLGAQLVEMVVRRATRIFGPAASSVGGLFNRVVRVVGRGVSAGFDLLLRLVERGRQFGEGVLGTAVELVGGMLSRVGHRVLDFVSGIGDRLMPVVNVVTGMVRNRVSEGQDFLARLTHRGAEGLVTLIQMGLRGGLELLGGARNLGYSAVDAATGIGATAIQRGAGLADGFVRRGVGIVQSVIQRGTEFILGPIGLGTRTAHSAVSMAERIATRPVQMLSGYLPPFAIPVANRYLSAAGHVGRAVHGLVERAGSGAAGGAGWLGRLLQGAMSVGGNVARGGISRMATAGSLFLRSVSQMARRTVDRVSGNSMGFMSRMLRRATTAVQTGANLAARLIRSPIATTHSGIQTGIHAVANSASRTASFAQGIINQGAAALGASATNPAVTGAHAVVSFAEQAAVRATQVVSSVTSSIFGWLQRDGDGPQAHVSNPEGLAQGIRQKERNLQLPPHAREMLTSQLGFDVSLARIHAGPESDRASKALNANAFTIGQDVFFRMGQYEPHSAKGQSLLAHELTHVVQQSSGRTSAQRFRDSGGDAMEREAQDEGRAMVLAIRERNLGGIDRHDVESRRSDGASVSQDDLDRLARIQEMMEAKVMEKASAAGLNRLVSSPVQVDVSLELEQLSDEQAAEKWASVVIASIRTTAEPIKVRSQLAVQRDVRSGLNAEAQQQIGIVPGMREPSGIQLNRRRTQQYARMYLSNPRIFKWAGLAAFASRLVGQGIAASQAGRAAGMGMLAGGSPLGMPLIMNPLDQALLQGNRAIYDNIFWMHMAYRDGGIERIRQAHAEGTVPDAMLNAWELISEGEETGDESKIWAGNREFARHEQQVVVQPIYDENPNLFGAMSVFMMSPAPGMEPGLRAPYDGEFMQQAAPGANLANSEDRWNWVDQHMLPHWRALETEQPERIRYLLLELEESGGLINTFEDTDIREGVATRSDEDLAAVSVSEKVRMVNRLLGGWISDEDVDAAVRLLETVDSEDKVRDISAGIAEAMRGMWSSSQRGRLQLALSRATQRAALRAKAQARVNAPASAPAPQPQPSRSRNSRTNKSRRPSRRTRIPEPDPTPEPIEQPSVRPDTPEREVLDPARRNALEALAHAERMAEFADDVYASTGAPVGAKRLDTDPEEMKRMRLTRESFHDEDSGFDAAVYQEVESGRIIIAFRGTEPTSLADWRTNVGQGTGMKMEQYQRAVSLARTVRDTYEGVPMEITGHSLGGGLATIASAATGIRATTFNAANVHADTYDHNRTSADRVGEGSVNYTVDGEPLTGFQDHGRGFGTGLGVVGGGLALGPLGVILGGVMGRRAGTEITHSPLRREVLEARNADGTEMGTFEHTAGHGMTAVREALAYRRAALESSALKGERE